MNKFSTLNAKAMNYESIFMHKPGKRLDRDVLLS